MPAYCERSIFSGSTRPLSTSMTSMVLSSEPLAEMP
jgi:hypothetical protein